MNLFVKAFAVSIVSVWIFSEAISRKVVKNSKGDLLFLNFKHVRTKRSIPDLESVLALGFNLSAIATVKDSYLDQFEELPSLGSLKPENATPDEKMRVRVAKILILAHPSYIFQSHHYPGRINPSIELVENELLMAWRDGIYNSPIKFAWLDKERLKYFPSEHKHFGIPNFNIPSIEKFHFNQLQEDPRLVYVASRKTLSVMYTAKEQVMAGVMMCYLNITASNSTASMNGYLRRRSLLENDTKDKPDMTMSASVILHNPIHTYFDGPKNWVPFLRTDQHSTDKLLFIQNIHPLHILEHVSTDPVTHVGSMRRVQYDPLDARNTSATEPVPLPWAAEYGSLIRGGTPAILVPYHHHPRTKSVYVAFFHTVAQYHMRTYYMGAVTICNSRPYKIHSISEHPIIPDILLYDGAWLKNWVVDYVVFPTGTVKHFLFCYFCAFTGLHCLFFSGIVLLDGNNTLLVSYGSQDKDGYISEMDLSGLLQSMEIVSECE